MLEEFYPSGRPVGWLWRRIDFVAAISGKRYTVPLFKIEDTSGDVWEDITGDPEFYTWHRPGECPLCIEEDA